ncbi:MAG: trypsin-like peptidase domain-containing protein [Bacteroidales bacterium]|jgi:Do/DeqQ family serine protease|nr:trypsin-like peptidase domain-containing protein [Bacteroidales bacterium]MDY0053937.1 trypsin-like peptidase domain-containing protein [Bacteroidales bacterium]
MKNNILKTVVLISFTLLFYNCTKAQKSPYIDFTQAAEHTVHAVVHIQCEYSQQTLFYEDFFGFLNPQLRNRTYQTSGSGVIIKENGYIITNNHVVQDADKIQVTLNDKRTFKAEIIGNDPSADLAVLKIEAKELPIIEFGDSDKTKIGQWVLAVGNPFNLTSTVTAGIISAKARNLNILGKKMAEEPLDFFIQTDAAVNSGNSGGALVDTEGKLIGINTAIASNTGSYSGYSFAIPSNIVKKISNDLIKYGITQKAYLGLNIAEIDSRLAENKNIKEIKGLYIASIIEGGAADKSNLKEGDIITKINDKNINSLAEMNEILSQSSPGDKIEVVFERENNIKSKTITLLNEIGTTSIIKAEEISKYESLGAEFRELTSKERNQYKIKTAVVVENTKNSVFANIGIRNGFIITSIDKMPISKLKDLDLLKTKKGKVVIEGFYPNDFRTFYYVIML